MFSQGDYSSWKVMEFSKTIFQAWKVMENSQGHGNSFFRSWKSHGKSLLKKSGHPVFC